MTSSISWIDREGLDETLARIGFRGRPVPARASSQPLPSPPGRQASPTKAPAALEPTVTPEFLPPDGPLRQRLEAFITWLVQMSGSNVAFIVDRDGLPLVDREADPDLLTVASSVMRLVARINGKLLVPVGRAVTIELEERQLMLIAVETPIGKYIIGQVGERPLSRDLCDAAADALRRAFQPSPGAETTGF